MNYAEISTKLAQVVQKYSIGWSDFPSETLDSEAHRYITATQGDPRALVESVIPFDVSGLLSEVSTGISNLARLRAQTFDRETSLLLQTLNEKTEQECKSSDQQVSSLQYLANWETAQKAGIADPAPAVRRLQLQQDARDMRTALRSVSGHPLNLSQQIRDLRELYLSELRRALAKAETARLMLGKAYGYTASSPIDLVSPASDASVALGQWLDKLTLGLEENSMETRVATIYRLVGAHGLSAQSIATLLRSAGKAEIVVNLGKPQLGMTEEETGRILAIGLAIVWGDVTRFANETEANKFSSLVFNCRSLRKQYSFDANVTFPAFSISDSGQVYNFPEATESFFGVRGWGVDDGAAEGVLQLRTGGQIANRPVFGQIQITVAQEVFSNAGVSSRTAIPNELTNESGLTDILVGVKFAAHRRRV